MIWLACTYKHIFPIVSIFANRFLYTRPILDYGGRGVSKPGVRQSDHAIIHTGKHAPIPLRGEKGLGHKAIRVDKSSKLPDLAVQARLNYGKICIVTYDSKVHLFGRIHHEKINRFQRSLDALWTLEELETGSSSSVSRRDTSSPRTSYQPTQEAPDLSSDYTYQIAPEHRAQRPLVADQTQYEPTPSEDRSGSLNEDDHGGDDDGGEDEEGTNRRRPPTPDASKPKPNPGPVSQNMIFLIILLHE